MNMHGPKTLRRALLPIALVALARPALADEPAKPSPRDCARLLHPDEAHGAFEPAQRVGEARAYEPGARMDLGDCMRIDVPASLAGRLENVSRFPVDRYGNGIGGASASPELRLGARFTSGLRWAPFVLGAELEVDALTGVAARTPAIAGDGFPGGQGLDLQLRKAYARLSVGRWAHLSVGAQTSHFGMGLVSNDGAHGWTPGSARFDDPRGGDRVLRAQLATGPGPDLGLLLALGADHVLADDFMLSGDTADQLFGALLFGAGKPVSGGFSIARRHQTNAAGRATDVTIVDLTAKAATRADGVGVGLETEWAVIAGETGLGATVEHPTSKVLQVGGAARASIEAGALGAVIDFLYASGDQNPYDGKQNAFRADPNFSFGLLLFRQVMAAQSARGVGTASDPQLVGIATDAERLATRGGATNTVALFPKLLVRPTAGVEAYGGPLVAFANVPHTDVFNTEVGGGAPRGPLGAPAGQSLGLEVDVGVRMRTILYGTELTLGLEGGAFAPSDAMRALDGGTMGTVWGGRALLRYRL